MNNKVVILGDGYVGNHLYNILKDKWECVVLSSKTVNYHDPKTFHNYLLNKNPKYVINCSGFTGRPNVDEAEDKKELCWFLNVTSPLNILRECDKRSIRYIHIGSGCIYDGFEHIYNEKDDPDYGLFSNYSSFYSKTKHAFEVESRNHPFKLIRIRMPISSINDERCFLSKIKKYDRLISYMNSKTDLDDLGGFINVLMKNTESWGNSWWELNQDIYNVVNPVPLTTREICVLMERHGHNNPNWTFVSLDDLDIKAGRSNCVLDNSKASKLYKFKTEGESIVKFLKG